MDVTEEGFRLLAWSVSSSVTINVFPQQLNADIPVCTCQRCKQPAQKLDWGVL